MAQELWWASASFWRKTAVWVTGFSFLILIFLTFDTMSCIQAGGKQVPGYAIINKRVDYQFNEAQNRYLPVIGPDEPLFGKMLSEAGAAALVSKGKLTTQAHPWYVQGMKWRQISGWAFTLGYVLLVWDLLTIGKRETRPAVVRGEAHAAA